MDLFQFTDYLNVVFGERDKNLRLGQWAVIVLCRSFPVIYNKIINLPNIDPFYTDSNLKSFLQNILDIYVSQRIIETPNKTTDLWSDICKRTIEEVELDSQPDLLGNQKRPYSCS